MTIDFSEDELVDVVNSAVFTAFHALEDNDETAWRIATLTVTFVAKVEAAYPALIEAERFECAQELLVLRRRVEHHRHAH